MSGGIVVNVGNTTKGLDGIENADGSIGMATNHPDAFAQERNVGTSNQYGVGVDECNGSILDAGTGAQAVSAGAPALLFGIHINTALAGTLTITGLSNVTGAATDIVLPIATAIGYFEFKGAKCDTALICTLSDATDGVLVLWRPQ